MLPNDVFKRPGPHHAYEADVDRVARMRGALEALQLAGETSAMAAVLGCTPAEVAEPGRLYGLGLRCVAPDADDIGMRHYGPLLWRAGAAVVTGDPLLPYVNPTITPVSMFWADHAPYIPELVARARDVLPLVETWKAIPEEDWAQVREEVDDPALLARWRHDYLAEVAQLARDLAPLAQRDALLISWMDEQGWL